MLAKVEEQHGLETEVATVTPVMAQTWMDHRAPNRRIDSNKVMTMARDMVGGRWQLTHQGIAFDEEGMLIDGQHRLAAIIMANLPVQMMVARNLPRDAQLVIDDHRPRNGADVLTIQTGHSVDSLTVALLRAVENPAGSPSGSYSKSELADALELHGRACEFVTSSLARRERGVTLAPVLAPAARAFYTQDRERVAEFLKVLSTGIPQHSPDDTAALRLRDWCISSRDGRGRPTRADYYKRAQNALRHFLERRDPARLMAADGDLFPLPEGMERPKSIAAAAKRREAK